MAQIGISAETTLLDAACNTSAAAACPARGALAMRGTRIEQRASETRRALRRARIASGRVPRARSSRKTVLVPWSTAGFRTSDRSVMNEEELADKRLYQDHGYAFDTGTYIHMPSRSPLFCRTRPGSHFPCSCNECKQCRSASIHQEGLPCHRQPILRAAKPINRRT